MSGQAAVLGMKQCYSTFHSISQTGLQLLSSYNGRVATETMWPQTLNYLLFFLLPKQNKKMFSDPCSREPLTHKQRRNFYRDHQIFAIVISQLLLCPDQIQSGFSPSSRSLNFHILEYKKVPRKQNVSLLSPSTGNQLFKARPFPLVNSLVTSLCLSRFPLKV